MSDRAAHIDWIVILVVFAIPVIASALVGYLLGSWLVFVLLCLPLCALSMFIFVRQADPRAVADGLAEAAEASLADGNRFSAAALFRQAADILESVTDLDDRERAFVDEWRARADALESAR